MRTPGWGGAAGRRSFPKMDISVPPHGAIWHWPSEAGILAQASLSLGGAFQRIQLHPDMCGSR